MKSYYFDYASSTPISDKALTEFNKISREFYANPVSNHHLGEKARLKLEEYRFRMSKILNCLPEEIIFTGSGSEGNLIAISGAVKDNDEIITTPIEHKSVIKICNEKSKNVKFVNVDKNGIVDAKNLVGKINGKSRLVTIQYVNNEIGCVQNIKKIVNLVKRKNKKTLFHTDACQATLLDLNVKKLSVDLMTLNSSKCYGPKGVGLLFRSKNVKLFPVMIGGGQEFGLRSGTHNLAGIGGFVVALEEIQKRKKALSERLEMFRELFVREINKIDGVKINCLKKSICSIINIGFKDIEAETLLNYLSGFGIAVSVGSACESGNVEMSHVLRAIGADEKYGYIRISIGKDTTKTEILYLVKKLVEVVSSLRKL